MTDPEKPNVIEIGPKLAAKRLELTDKILHGQCQDTIKTKAECDDIASKIAVLTGQASASRLMPNHEQVLEQCAGKINKLGNGRIVIMLNQVMENQLVIMHSLHRSLYPDSPPILVVKEDDDDPAV